MKGSYLPPRLREDLEAALPREESGARMASAERVGGGDINEAARVETDSGRRYFVKWNERAPEGFFAAEANGLRALARSVALIEGRPRLPGAAATSPAQDGPEEVDPGLRIPEVIAVGGGETGPGWLLLEWVERGRSGRSSPAATGPARSTGPESYGTRLGRGLAALHRPEGSDFGWPEDNFIGPLPQRNEERPDWPSFWGELRIVPQVERARRAGHLRGTDREFDTLLDRLGDILAPAADDGPSLLHGDLWSGNVFPDERGRPVLVDPAVYRGHREVDLAMAGLFGGFPEDFFAAYREIWPLVPGYAETRRSVYQLYPLLVHLNLFGGGYEGGVLRALESVLRST